MGKFRNFTNWIRGRDRYAEGRLYSEEAVFILNKLRQAKNVRITKTGDSRRSSKKVKACDASEALEDAISKGEDRYNFISFELFGGLRSQGVYIDLECGDNCFGPDRVTTFSYSIPVGNPSWMYVIDALGDRLRIS